LEILHAKITYKQYQITTVSMGVTRA